MSQNPPSVGLFAILVYFFLIYKLEDPLSYISFSNRSSELWKSIKDFPIQHRFTCKKSSFLQIIKLLFYSCFLFWSFPSAYAFIVSSAPALKEVYVKKAAKMTQREKLRRKHLV